MKKIIVLLLLIMLMGCGTMGYRVSKRTGDNGEYKGEIYYDIAIINFDKFWKK